MYAQQRKTLKIVKWKWRQRKITQICPFKIYPVCFGDFQSEHKKIKNKIPLLRARRFVLAIAIKCRSSMAQTDPAFT